METAFINELGHRIRITVEKRPDMGMVEQVAIMLEGPDSVAENIITLGEADVLLGLLAEFRGKSLSGQARA